ncbi:TPA: deaminase domain-containing protein [Neisseria subflava]
MNQGHLKGIAISSLKACQSCSNVILEFRNRYPNIQLNIFTGK